MKFARIYSLALLSATLFMSACGNDDSGSTPQPQQPQSQAEYYFRATLDGQTVNFEELPNNNYHMAAYMSLSKSDGVITRAELGTGVRPFMQDNNQGFVGMSRSFAVAPTEAEMEAIWSVGTKTYTDADYATYGATVGYADAAGKYWSTQLGSGNQNGSTFTVTDVTQYNNTLTGKKSKTVKGTFSCKLYSSEGEVKILTNGSYRGVIQYEE